MRHVFLALVLCACAPLGCATSHQVAPRAQHPDDRCAHGVACETCVKCHPELAARFRGAGDWCPEHGVPESQCGICHPEVMRAPPAAPEGRDVRRLVAAGEDLAALEPHAVAGKVTIFDFYADWCGPCLKVDEHIYDLLAQRDDIAYRKLNIVAWESPLARHHLVAAQVPSLPYVVVYGRDGRRVRAISGLDLAALDAAIAEASTR